MKTYIARAVLIAAFLVAGTIVSPSILFAQATPGPIAPATPSDTPESAHSKDKPALPTNSSMNGSWKLNTDDSDDGRKKM